MSTVPNCFRRASGWQLEEVDGEYLFHHPEKPDIAYCNQSAALVWQLCDGSRTIQEIVVLLLDAYPESAATIPQEVASAVFSLCSAGILEAV